MKNEITKTSKPVLQSDEQAPVDKTSKSISQDNAILMRRRRLLKGLGAAPLVMTLHNGAAMAASSTGGCVGQLPPPDEADRCVAGTGTDHDSFLRVEVDVENDCKVDLPGWTEPHPYCVDNPDPERNLCLVSVDPETGDIDTNTVDTSMLTTNSCWCSFA